MNKTPLFRRKWVKVLVVVFIVLVVAYIIPIPEVGKPVEEIATSRVEYHCMQWSS